MNGLHPLIAQARAAAAAWRAGVHQAAAWCMLAALLVVALPGSVGLAAPLSLAQLEHRRWLAADGGPNQVGAIAQSHDGYLWLGTNDSLYRFDGFRFVRVESSTHNTLNIVASLLATQDRLWVGLRFGGVRTIEAGTMQSHPVGPLPEGAVYALARDLRQTIWAAADDGLARFDGVHWQRVGADWNFPGQRARAVQVDRAGTVWAANENRLFYLPDGARAFMDTGLDVDWASQIAQAPDGAIWLTERYRGRLHRVTLKEGRIDAQSIHLEAPSIGLLFDSQGALWIGTTGQGLRHVPVPTSLNSVLQHQTFTEKDGLSSNFVWKMLADSEGNVWVGTNGGLDRFRPKTLLPAGFPQGALNVALAAGADGSIWAGPSNQSAVRLSEGRLTPQSMPAPISSAMRDAEGRVWMAGPHGIWRSHGSQLHRIASLPPGVTTESPVRAMARDGRGDLWVSINRVGLFKLSGGVWTATPPRSESASQRMPVTAVADPDGRLWFGYRDNLLILQDGDDLRRWGAADGLDIGHVTAIAHHADTTWVGGQHGVGRIAGGRFHRLRLPDNGLFNNIYGLVPVPRSGAAGADLWVQSRAGIFQFSASDLEQAFADPGYRLGYRSYELMGGLANDPYQVLPLPTAVRSDDGRIWFSTSNGVVYIDPDQVPVQRTSSNVVIESVSVDGARLPDLGRGAPVRLEPGARRIALAYTAPSLSAPERVGFRYRLDGYDRAWHDAGGQREAVYTGLGPGNYRFRVLAHNKDGLSSPQETVVEFVIPPMFYRQPAFIALTGVLATVLLVLLHRRSAQRATEAMRQRLEERYSERERIARELHDTLLQGFHGLTLRFQAAADVLSVNHPARQELERALERADEVLADGRDRVRGLRSSVTDLGSLQDRLRMQGEELAQAGPARFQLLVRHTPVPLNPLVSAEFHLIGQEAIANAFRHANARQVTVEIDYGAQRFNLRISDDGSGIQEAHLGPQGRPHHWGLRGMHERAQRIGAVLVIRSQTSSGSVVALSIKAALAYGCSPAHAPLPDQPAERTGSLS